MLNERPRTYFRYSSWPLALVLLFLFCWGDPDLLDALIRYFGGHA